MLALFIYSREADDKKPKAQRSASPNPNYDREVDKTRKDLSMPNIDTSTIEGFDSMTAEQKVEALLKAEIPEKVDLSRYVSKETFDKKASEASALSKQLKDKSLHISVTQISS